MHEQYVKSESINDKLFIDKSIPRVRLHATNGNHSLKKKILLKKSFPFTTTHQPLTSYTHFRREFQLLTTLYQIKLHRTEFGFGVQLPILARPLHIQSKVLLSIKLYAHLCKLIRTYMLIQLNATIASIFCSHKDFSTQESILDAY